MKIPKKIKRKYIYLFVQIISIAFVTSIILLSCSFNNTRSLKGNMQTDMWCMFATISYYYSLKGFYPIMTSTNKVEYISILLKEICSDGEVKDTLNGLERTFFIGTNTWMWLDPWKTPYNIEIRSVTMTSNEFNRVFGSDLNDIIIWSSGINKINEYGRGDDILDIKSDGIINRKQSWGCHARRQ